MPTKFNFSGRTISIPGAYSRITSGIKNPSLSLEFGNCLVINTGSERWYTGGPGINGTLKSGKDSLITFDNSRDFKNYLGGGLWWLLASPIFSPGGGATAGASSVTYIDAATTIAAEISLPFGGQDASDSDDIGTNNGNIVVQVRAEGFAGNGVLGNETRAKATISITNAGVGGNIITVFVDGLSIGTYTVASADTIAQVVAGLASAITAYGLCEVYSQNATQIVIYAPRGKADLINATSPTFSFTGSVNAITTTFSGGVEGTLLTRGYGAQVLSGIKDTSKFIVKFYRGSFKGMDGVISNTTEAPYDTIAETSTVPELIAQSPEVNTVQALVTWMQDTSGTGFTFDTYFKIKSYSIATLDQVLSNDLQLSTEYLKASGGSSSFGSSDLSAVLDSVEDLTFDFILSDNWGTNATSANNLAIQDWIINTAKIKPDLYVAAGSLTGEFTASLAVAISFNSQYVTVVHGGAKKIAAGNRGFKEYEAIYKAAALLGREAGLEPQIPLTFKNIGIDGELDPISNKRAEQALDAGLLVTRLDAGSFEVVKGVNSLQANTYLVNADGSTHSKQFARIERQLNKEITQNAKTILLKSPSGANRNTISAEVIEEFVKSYLNSKIATGQTDNLLIGFRAVSAVRNQDAYEVTYAFEPNSELSAIFFTGVAVDPS